MPFGILDGLFGGQSARRYTSKTILPFFKILHPIVIDYYEYQLKDSIVYFYEKDDGLIHNRVQTDDFRLMHGKAVWRRIPIEMARAKNEHMTDGILCCILKK